MTTPTSGAAGRPRIRPGTPRRLGRIALAILVVLLLVQIVPRLLSLLVEWRWYSSVGATSVLRTELLTRLGLFAAVGTLVGGAVMVALYLAYRSRPVFLPPPGSPDVLARYRAAFTTGPRSASVWGPIVLGVLAGAVAQASWRVVLAFVSGGDFGVADPQFGHDIGFYAFDLPFWRLVVNWSLVAVVSAFCAALVAQYIFGGVRPGAREGALTRGARMQLAALAGIFVLIKAAGYWLDRYQVLSQPGTVFTGAGYTDVTTVIPGKVFMFAVALVCAFAFFSGIVLRDLRIPAVATVLMVFSALVVGTLWPLAVEQFSVSPNRAVKEREYIARNIEATRAAYGIGGDKVTYVRDWGAQTPDPARASADTQTLSNIRVLDPNVLAPTFTQQQQLKNFYGFPDRLSVDRYRVGGRMQDYVVGVRELNPSALRDNQQVWVNRHTTYTHGNGFVAAPADKVDEIAAEAGADRGGLPAFQVSDVDSAAGGARTDIPVEQPRVYFGPVIAGGDPDYAIVGGGGDPREYDTDSRKYTYTGSGGAPVGDWLSRIAFASEFRERNILLSSLIDSDSKILFDRDPRERVRKVAPWLTTDDATYPVVVDGRIQWVVDGYTTLQSYPYAEQTSLDDAGTVTPAGARIQAEHKVSYARNSVKAVVDAYDGSVSLYAWDDQDPVLATWRKAFPGTVADRSAMSPALAEHMRYPQDLFSVQRSLLTRYHVDDPGQFFTNDAFWSVPTEQAPQPVSVPTTGPAPGAGAAGPAALNPVPAGTPAQPPYYVVAADPRAADPASAAPSFQLVSALRGFSREILAAHMSASSDPATFGQITVRVQRPLPTSPPGPNQAEGQMLSSPKVAQDRALWERAATVTDGNLLALPLGGDSMLYVEPVYTQRKGQDGSIPRLTRVMAFYNGQIGYAPTVHEALAQVGIESDPSATKTAVKPPASAPSGPSSPTLPKPGPGAAPGRDAAVKGLDDALGKVRQAQQGGDLGALGTALEDLQKAVDAYRASAPTPAAQPTG